MPKKNVIIFANGKLKNLQKAKQIAQNADYCICADGGAIHCDKLNITPDLVIGDLDSIPIKLQKKFSKKKVNVEQHPRHKDKTDLELALQRAIRYIKKKGEIHILGGLGGRQDMNLASILLLTENSNTAHKITLHGDKEKISLLTPKQHKIHGKPGQQISFLPLLGDVKDLSLTGFTYNADEITLKAGSAQGVSNCFEKTTGLIRFSKGLLLMIKEEV